MSNGKTRSKLPSFGQKNKFRTDSDQDKNLPDPNSFTIAGSADSLLTTNNTTDPSVQSTIDNLMSATPEPTTYKPPRSKTPLYIALGTLACLAVLIFAGVGIYATFFHENPLDIKTEIELRRAKDGKTLSSTDIPSKSPAELTDEERENNDYVYYKVDLETKSILSDIAESIDDRFISSELTLANAEGEYKNVINSRNEASEKAYLLLREADLIAYALNEDDEDSIALMGELIFQAEELFPTIASADKVANWESYYGSAEKSETYYQLMYQRQLDNNYINEIPGGVAEYE